MPLEGKDKVVEDMVQRTDKFCRALGLEGMRRLFEKTPVDTGRARANWNAGIGEVNLDEREVEVKRRPNRREGESQHIPDEEAMREGLAMGLATAAEFKGGQRLYLTNGLEYIPELENGHSRQAPDGMVALTVAELRPIAAATAQSIRITGGDFVVE